MLKQQHYTLTNIKKGEIAINYPFKKNDVFDQGWNLKSAGRSSGTGLGITLHKWFSILVLGTHGSAHFVFPLFNIDSDNELHILN